MFDTVIKDATVVGGKYVAAFVDDIVTRDHDVGIGERPDCLLRGGRQAA